MRRRLVVSFLTVTTVVLILLAVPMGYLLQRVATEESKAQLTKQAQYLLSQITTSSDGTAQVDTTALEAILPPGSSAVMRLADGRSINIRNPDTGPLISVRVSDGAGDSVTVRASAAPVQQRVRPPLIILAGLGLAGLLTTWLLAQSEARRLGQPIGELAATAARLGSGDFSVKAPRSGVDELDSLATTLDASAARIDALVRAERRFNSDAGHQLRSALTSLRLRLEELTTSDDPFAVEEAHAALEQADRLSDTIDALLRLSRTGRAGVATRFDLRSLAGSHAVDVVLPLRRQRREVEIIPGPPLVIEAAPGAVGQTLDVLLWNAVRHGRGQVTVRVESDGDWAELTVRDQGSIDATSVDEMFVQSATIDDHGIGLPLARRIIESEGGRLDVASMSPTTFRIRLPIPEPESDAKVRGGRTPDDQPADRADRPQPPRSPSPAGK